MLTCHAVGNLGAAYVTAKHLQVHSALAWYSMLTVQYVAENTLQQAHYNKHIAQAHCTSTPQQAHCNKHTATSTDSLRKGTAHMAVHLFIALVVLPSPKPGGRFLIICVVINKNAKSMIAA